jgi:hypothetical protein
MRFIDAGKMIASEARRLQYRPYIRKGASTHDFGLALTASLLRTSREDASKPDKPKDFISH